MSARRALAWLAAGAVLAACASGYDAYRAAHPGWDGAFPNPEADLAQTLVALQGPRGRGYTTTVQAVQVWKLDSGSWTPIEAPPQASPRDTYGVVASLQCVADDGQTRFLASQQNWYLLREDRLVAYDHHRFGTGCSQSDDFAPARPALAGDEQKLLERAGLCRPACALGALEYYGKGQAFAHAGRSDEAREMLTKGDQSGSVGYDTRQRFSDSRGAQHGNDAALETAREALVHQLAAAGK